MTLLLPTDGCPECLIAVPVHPWMTYDSPERGFGAYYRCPECGHDWQTGWSRDAVNLPCTGCPACRSEKGQVA